MRVFAGMTGPRWAKSNPCHSDQRSPPQSAAWVWPTAGVVLLLVIRLTASAQSAPARPLRYRRAGPLTEHLQHERYPRGLAVGPLSGSVRFLWHDHRPEPPGYLPVQIQDLFGRLGMLGREQRRHHRLAAPADLALDAQQQG